MRILKVVDRGVPEPRTARPIDRKYAARDLAIELPYPRGQEYDLGYPACQKQNQSHFILARFRSVKSHSGGVGQSRRICEAIAKQPRPGVDPSHRPACVGNECREDSH